MESEPGALTVPFELTHVRYAAGDAVGYTLALASLTPLAIVVALGTLVAIRRDVRTISFFTGALERPSARRARSAPRSRPPAPAAAPTAPERRRRDRQRGHQQRAQAHHPPAAAAGCVCRRPPARVCAAGRRD